MFYRVLAYLIVLTAIFANAAFAEPDSFSITDFTLHKITPEQGKATISPIFNSSTDEQPVTPKKQAQTPIKHKNTYYRTKNSVKTAVTPAKSNIVTPKKQPETVKETIAAEETPQVATKEPDKNPAQTGTEQKNESSFNKQEYTEHLNSFLEQGNLSDEKKQTPASSSFDMYLYVIKPVVSLGIVLVLIFIFAWLYGKLRKLNQNGIFTGNFKGADINKFNVLASSALGQGKIIHLVEINGKQLVVGSTNNNISLLTEINPEDMEKLMAKVEKAEKPEKTPEKTEPEEIDEMEYAEPDSYSAKYTNLYKDYLE